jgi:endonuclease G, mitochondrial
MLTTTTASSNMKLNLDLNPKARTTLFITLAVVVLLALGNPQAIVAARSKKPGIAAPVINRPTITTPLIGPDPSGVTTLIPSLSLPATDNPNLLLGNPSQAVPGDRTNNLVTRPQYALSYNSDRGIPNWTSWQLNTSWLGTQPRRNFMPDLALPAPVITPNDYNNSGFDRGHMVPAADRNRSPEDSQAVFLMSNILPQAPDNNQGPWERLEAYSRDLVRQGKELYIIAGSSGTGGTGKNGTFTTIGKGKVAVPKSVWKVIVVLDTPGQSTITSQTRVIAVNMPNEQGIKDIPWQTYRISVDEIEAMTGYDLLSNVSKRIQTTVEKRVDALP